MTHVQLAAVSRVVFGWMRERGYLSDDPDAKRRIGSTIDKRAALAERRLTVHQRSVAAYCAGCEPEGRCVTPDCPLRPVSPLPLYERRLA